MYSSITGSRRSSQEHERRPSREQLDATNVHQYTRQSPISTPIHFSPTNGVPPHSPHFQYTNPRPTTSHNGNMSSAISPQLRPPPSPRSNGHIHGSPVYSSAQRAPSNFYDPTAEHRAMPPSRVPQNAPLKSPKQTLESPSYSSFHNDPKTSPRLYHPPAPYSNHHSPVQTSHHAHPPLRPESFPRSPVNGSFASSNHQPDLPLPRYEANGHRASYSSHSATSNGDILPQAAQIKDEQAPTRTANPMAFSSILSSNSNEPSKEQLRPPSPTKQQTKSVESSIDERNSSVSSIQKIAKKPAPLKSSPAPKRKIKKSAVKSISPRKQLNGSFKQALPSTSDKENEKIQKEVDRIDAMTLSDIEAPGWEESRNNYEQVHHERQNFVNGLEQAKRRRRREINTHTLLQKFDTHAINGRKRFRETYEASASQEVEQREKFDERERKKDMQRKRRRERTLEQAMNKRHDAMTAADNATDQGTRHSLIKEAQKAEKKVRATKRTLEQGDVVEDLREVTPIAPNLEGGTMGIFQTATPVSPEPPRKKIKGMSTRPKKSREQKLMEKAKAETGQLLLDNNDLPQLAPKGESRRETIMRETKSARRSKEVSPAPSQTNYDSKGFSQIFDQIIKDLSRKDVPKVYRIKDNSSTTKASNLRKTAQLAGKEGRRWQLKTNKGMKDTQARAKRGMREMMSFWKRNEREERDMRRVAEKQELENAKKAEADREANRQKRKLNFLISQTELYSHFIGRKIKTDEVERSTDDATVAASDRKLDPGKSSAHAIDLPGSVADTGTKVTNFEDLDFDAEDETVLRQAASANAQAAVQEAQDRARAFNNEGTDIQAQMDDGEMNFQNPAGMDNLDVPQPKMLTCQLKEYQLKGLNWLVNLYEQGINGILADEMGLGKTVQSISVMSYLAEKHNIWGPFLVIAPSSTLHNWQQEITRFVPDLKCLPYWGSAKDRKVLRKFWDRKHITYTKESPFHCLITSYQLVVQDSQYFQKIRWQYMILDEAQAIKSSQSSRWKSLLGFHCRNRLLLTGTPIQNNMQELWALLHFIMPSLFDSHDEFSDWFSKDIESHAQSNTKLNEDQLKRLHLILKPFMLRRVKKHVQKELGDKVEKDVYCDLTYRQRAYYGNLRSRISIIDLLEKAAVGDDQDTATLMNLVMQFRKVCNHPDLFERAEITSPLATAYWAECASFLREGNNVNVGYSTRNNIEYDLPRLLSSWRVDIPGPENEKAGFQNHALTQIFNIWTPDNILRHRTGRDAFSWLPLVNESVAEVASAGRHGLYKRTMALLSRKSAKVSWHAFAFHEMDMDVWEGDILKSSLTQARHPLKAIADDGYMSKLMNVSRRAFESQCLGMLEQCARPGAAAPPIQISCSDQATNVDKENTIFNIPMRKALYGISELDEASVLEAKGDPAACRPHNLLPQPVSQVSRFTNIRVPSMRRFVTDSGKLAKLDELLRELKNGGHRVLLYFQMTKMINLMEEYLTYRNYKYCRLDGSTKLEDRRDTVHDFQTRPDIFVFLLSTRAGGLGINLTAADTVIFYDSDWNPTIDSQAMDRAHRLGQTKQVTVYRLITRGTIEERIRKRALQKEEVQRVVISGGGGAGVDFNTRSKDNRTKDVMMWLADDDQAKLIEQKEKEAEERGDQGKKGKKAKSSGKKKDVSLDDMYHEGEGHFGDEASNKPSGTATPIDGGDLPSAGGKKGKGTSKKAKTIKQKLAVADGL